MPGGRPKGAKNKATEFIKPIAQRYGPDCLQMAFNIAKNGRSKDADRLKAMELIMAYGYGKPTESHEHSGPGGSAIPVSLEGLDEAIKSIVAGGSDI